MLTCRLAFEPGLEAFQVSGWPVHLSVDGIWKVPSVLTVVLALAQATHLSRTALAVALPLA